MGAYNREVAFYRGLADRLDGPLPRCYLAEYDETEGRFTVVLQDVADAVQGDQIAGCSVGQARLAMRELAEQAHVDRPSTRSGNFLNVR